MYLGVDDDVPERTEFLSVTLESDNVDAEVEESRSILTVTIEDDDGMKTVISTYTLNVIQAKTLLEAYSMFITLAGACIGLTRTFISVDEDTKNCEFWLA